MGFRSTGRRPLRPSTEYIVLPGHVGRDWPGPHLKLIRMSRKGGFLESEMLRDVRLWWWGWVTARLGLRAGCGFNVRPMHTRLCGSHSLSLSCTADGCHVWVYMIYKDTRLPGEKKKDTKTPPTEPDVRASRKYMGRLFYDNQRHTFHVSCSGMAARVVSPQKDKDEEDKERRRAVRRALQHVIIIRLRPVPCPSIFF